MKQDAYRGVGIALGPELVGELLCVCKHAGWHIKGCRRVPMPDESTTCESVTKMATKESGAFRGEVSKHPTLSRQAVNGILAGLLSSLSYGLTAFLVHFSPSRVPTTEVTFALGAVGCFLLLPMVSRDLPMLLRREGKFVWTRNVAGSISIVCLAWNLQHTSVGVANALFNISPLLVLVGGWCAGGRWPRLRHFAFLVLVVAGTSIYWRSGHGEIGIAVYLVGIVGALAASCSYLALKRATKTASPGLIIWGIFFATTIVSILSSRGKWVVPGFEDALLLLSIGVMGLISQYFVTRSFALLSASAAAVLVPSSIIWAVLIDSLVHRSGALTHALLGSLIYATGTVLALWEELSEIPHPRSITREVVTLNSEQLCQPD